MERRRAERTSPELSIAELGLGKRMEKLLTEANLSKVGDVLGLLEEKGDDGFTDIKGLGLKALADLKKSLRARGYTLPGDELPAKAQEAA